MAPLFKNHTIDPKTSLLSTQMLLQMTMITGYWHDLKTAGLGWNIDLLDYILYK